MRWCCRFKNKERGEIKKNKGYTFWGFFFLQINTHFQTILLVSMFLKRFRKLTSRVLYTRFWYTKSSSLNSISTFYHMKLESVVLDFFSRLQTQPQEDLNPSTKKKKNLQPTMETQIHEEEEANPRRRRSKSTKKKKNLQPTPQRPKSTNPTETQTHEKEGESDLKERGSNQRRKTSTTKPIS